MACNVRSVFSISLYKWLATIIRFFCYALFFVTQSVFCFAGKDSESVNFVNQILNQATCCNIDELVSSFDALEEKFIQSMNPSQVGRKFLQQFIDEINC